MPDITESIAEETTPVTESVAPTTEATTTETATETVTPSADVSIAPTRKLAGRFEKPEELEAEFLRKEGEVAALNRLATAPRTSAEPATKADPHADITDQQLVELKEANLLAASNPELSVADRQKAIRQVTLIDSEQRKRDVAHTQKAERQSAAQRNLASKAQAALKQYEKDLVPGNPLNDAAFEIFNDLVAAGNPDNPITRGLAVLSAAQIQGLGTNKAALEKDRGALVQNLNKALKETVASGAGNATTSAAPVTDWLKADKKAYDAKVRQVMGLD